MTDAGAPPNHIPFAGPPGETAAARPAVVGKTGLALGLVPYAAIFTIWLLNPGTESVTATICGAAGFLSVPVAFILGIVALFVDRRKAFAIAATVFALVNGPVMFIAAHVLD